jgi:hypothetical protein
MKNAIIHFKLKYFLIALIFSTIISSCATFFKKANQQGSNDNYCVFGQSVLTIDDSKVPTDIKSKIYAPNGIYDINNPNYNKIGRTLVIPFSTPDFPMNTSLTTKLIENEFFITGN